MANEYQNIDSDKLLDLVAEYILECENNKCNYKYKINNYNKEEDIKSDTLNKIYNIRITNNNIEII